MKDLKEFSNGGTIEDAQKYKAYNLMTTELGFLVYAPGFGLDSSQIFNQEFEIPTDSFIAYVNQRLTENYIDIQKVNKFVKDFAEQYVYNVG